jgi:hypothetical protein
VRRRGRRRRPIPILETSGRPAGSRWGGSLGVQAMQARSPSCSRVAPVGCGPSTGGGAGGTGALGTLRGFGDQGSTVRRERPCGLSPSVSSRMRCWRLL